MEDLGDVKEREGDILGDGKFSGIPRGSKKKGSGIYGTLEMMARFGNFRTLEMLRRLRFEILRNEPKPAFSYYSRN